MAFRFNIAGSLHASIIPERPERRAFGAMTMLRRHNIYVSISLFAYFQRDDAEP